jgi:hypothetical protein
MAVMACAEKDQASLKFKESSKEWYDTICRKCCRRGNSFLKESQRKLGRLMATSSDIHRVLKQQNSYIQRVSYHHLVGEEDAFAYSYNDCCHSWDDLIKSLVSNLCPDQTSVLLAGNTNTGGLRPHASTGDSGEEDICIIPPLTELLPLLQISTSQTSPTSPTVEVRSSIHGRLDRLQLQLRQLPPAALCIWLHSIPLSSSWCCLALVLLWIHHPPCHQHCVKQLSVLLSHSVLLPACLLEFRAFHAWNETFSLSLSHLHSESNSNSNSKSNSTTAFSSPTLDRETVDLWLTLLYGTAQLASWKKVQFAGWLRSSTKESRWIACQRRHPYLIPASCHTDDDDT